MWLCATAINDNDDDGDDVGDDDDDGCFSCFFVFEMYLLALSLGGSNLEPHKDRDSETSISRPVSCNAEKAVKRQLW